MAKRISSKEVDEALARLNALQYPPAEGSAEFKEVMQWYDQARRLHYKKGHAAAAGTICRLYIAHRQFTELRPYLNEMKALCEENGTWTAMYADCMLMGIETDCTFGDFDKAVDTANIFLGGLVNALESSQAIIAYVTIGNLYQMRGWHIRAMRVFHQGMNTREDFRKQAHFCGLWNNYAFSLFCVKQYDQALNQFTALMNHPEIVRTPYTMAHCHLFIAQVYAEGFNDYSKCMEHTKASLDISTKHGIRLTECLMLMAHGLNLTKLKRYEEALPALLNKEALQMVIDNPSEHAEILNAVAECLLHMNKPKEAWEYLQQVKEMLHHSDIYTVKIKYHDHCVQYHSLMGDMDAAAQCRNMRDRVQNQSDRVEFAMQLEQVNAMMELEEKQFKLETQKLKEEKMQQQLNHATQEKEMLKAAVDQRNALIDEFQAAIKKIERSDMKRVEIFKELNEKIVSVRNSNNEVGEHDLRFNEKYKKNSQIINAKYPQLSAAEIKIAILLASGLSNKEIASITLTTVRNVETHRLKIRKKMALNKGQDLIKKLVLLLN